MLGLLAAPALLHAVLWSDRMRIEPVHRPLGGHHNARVAYAVTNFGDADATSSRRVPVGDAPVGIEPQLIFSSDAFALLRREKNGSTTNGSIWPQNAFGVIDRYFEFWHLVLRGIVAGPTAPEINGWQWTAIPDGHPQRSRHGMLNSVGSFPRSIRPVWHKIVENYPRPVCIMTGACCAPSKRGRRSRDGCGDQADDIAAVDEISLPVGGYRRNVIAGPLRDACTGAAGLLAAGGGFLLCNRRWLFGSLCLLLGVGLLLWGGPQ